MDEFQKSLLNLLSDMGKSLFAICVLLFLIMIGVCRSTNAANPHADSVYFNSATDLIAYNNQVFDLRGQPDWEMKVER